VTEQRDILTQMLTYLSGIVQNPEHFFQSCNMEQKEIFLNNYCSTLQVFFHNIGCSNIDDAFLDSTIKLVIFMF